MNKHFKIKNVQEALGNLEFLAFEKVDKKTVGSGRNARTDIVGNRYSLLSDTQNDVSVVVRSEFPRVNFEYMSPVELINPVLVAVPRNAGRNSAYIEWEVFADGIKLKK